ncbi:hypothetical protein [Actinokineospora sp. NBRC 105648]|uniref:hypothetical protein n=1 Tax=Actinokineospora sp. NBRC 105648 TaxID=3032206 RepID=UPI0024A304A2|nr:hypothetical protein [Actinokineospora sp. NBRC 105648]GLZ37074.1 hypothetical protein Acsp05_06990 [Actinokineospora sp. NBRC 105648]
MREVGISEICRLTSRSVAIRGQDDLTGPGNHVVPVEVATEAVARLRKRGLVSAIVGVVLLAVLLVFIYVISPALWGSYLDAPSFVLPVGSLLIAAGLMLVVTGAVGRVRWSARAESVGHFGWTPGVARVDPAAAHVVLVDLADNRKLRLATTAPVNLKIPYEIREGNVLVGGEGEASTLVFTNGPVLAAARALPV